MILFRIALIAVLGGIAYLSLSPTTAISAGNDKLGHFIAYAVLMVNIGLLTLDTTKRLIAGVLIALAYGALMEWGQSFVPGRTTSGYDMVANATGVAIGLVITLLFGRTIRKIFVRSPRK